MAGRNAGKPERTPLEKRRQVESWDPLLPKREPWMKSKDPMLRVLGFIAEARSDLMACMLAEVDRVQFEEWKAGHEDEYTLARDLALCHIEAAVHATSFSYGTGGTKYQMQAMTRLLQLLRFTQTASLAVATKQAEPEKPKPEDPFERLLLMDDAEVDALARSGVEDEGAAD